LKRIRFSDQAKADIRAIAGPLAMTILAPYTASLKQVPAMSKSWKESIRPSSVYESAITDSSSPNILPVRSRFVPSKTAKTPTVEPQANPLSF
jgi:hypothetical protein